MKSGNTSPEPELTFTEKYESYYKEHNKAFSDPETSPEDKLSSCLSFIGVSDRKQFEELSPNLKKAKINKLFREQSLIYHTDKVPIKDRELATNLFVLLEETRKFLLNHFQEDYLQQAKKIHQFQYELGREHDEETSFSDQTRIFYKNMAEEKTRKYHLIQYWETDKSGKSLILFGDTAQSPEIKNITMYGPEAFIKLLAAGTISAKVRGFNGHHCRTAVEKMDFMYQFRILMNENTAKYLGGSHRKGLAQKLIKDKEFTDNKGYWQLALTNENFNNVLEIEDICKIAYRCWELNKPENVFIHYYDNYPELLRIEDFLKIEKFNTQLIFDHLEKKPNNLKKLKINELIEISKVYPKIILDDPLLLARLIGRSYPTDWITYVKTLVADIPNHFLDLQPFELNCIEQFLLGKLKGNVFSEILNNKIKDIIEFYSNNIEKYVSKYLPAWMIDLWINPIEMDPEEANLIKSLVRIEILAGNFSVLNDLNPFIASDALKDVASVSEYFNKNYFEKIKEQINNKEIIKDLPDEDKNQFKRDNADDLKDCMDEKIRNFLGNTDINIETDLDDIVEIYQQIKKIYPQSNESLQIELAKSYQENIKKLFLYDELSNEEKINIKKVSTLCKSLQLERIWWHDEDEITSCISSMMADIINNVKYYKDDTVYKNNHQNGVLFGIKMDEKLSTIETLKRLFDVCNLLGANEYYFNRLKYELEALRREELPDDIFSGQKVFPADPIREIMLNALRIEFAAFVDGKRENSKEQGGSSNKYDICSFEFLKSAYENLDAGEEYKKGLDHAYRRIREGDVQGPTKFQGPVEKYYEIRKVERKYIDQELDQAIRRMELGNVAQENFNNLPKDNRPKFISYVIPEKNQSYGEKLLALTNASSANSNLLIEASKKNKKEKSKLSSQTPMQVTLKEIADNYDPKNPSHVEFIRDITSPVISPVLSQQIEAEKVDLKNKESVKEMVITLIDSINTNVSPAVLKERKILISEVKRLQDKICGDLKYHLDPNKTIHDSLDENKRYLNISNKLYDDLKLTSYPLESLTRSLLSEINIINNLNLKKILPDAYVSRIIKHLFTHVNNDHLYTNIVSGLVKLIEDKSIKNVDKCIDIFLQIMEYYEPTYLEEDYYLPEKLAKVIHICSKLNSDINFETIKQLIDSGSINAIEFAYKFQDKLPEQQNLTDKLDRLTNIYLNKNLKKSFLYICNIGSEFKSNFDREMYTFQPNPFTPEEISALMDCAEKFPDNFNYFSHILTIQGFKKEFIPRFCSVIERLSQDGIYLEKTSLGNHHSENDFSRAFSQKINLELFTVILENTLSINKITQQKKYSLSNVENYLNGKPIDPLSFELTLIMESADIVDVSDKENIFTMFSQVDELNYDEFIANLMDNNDPGTGLKINEAAKEKFISALEMSHSERSLYLLCCLSTIGSYQQFFANQDYNAFFYKALKRLEFCDPNTKWAKNIASYLADTLLFNKENFIQQQSQQEWIKHIDWLRKTFNFEVLKAKEHYDSYYQEVKERDNKFTYSHQDIEKKNIDQTPKSVETENEESDSEIQKTTKSVIETDSLETKKITQVESEPKIIKSLDIQVTNLKDVDGKSSYNVTNTFQIEGERKDFNESEERIGSEDSTYDIIVNQTKSTEVDDDKGKEGEVNPLIADLNVTPLQAPLRDTEILNKEETNVIGTSQHEGGKPSEKIKMRGGHSNDMGYASTEKKAPSLSPITIERENVNDLPTIELSDKKIEIISGDQGKENETADQPSEIPEQKLNELATTCFSDENNQHNFIGKVKTILQDDHNQGLSSACVIAYEEITRSIIAKTADKLPPNQQEKFISVANMLSKNYIASTNVRGTFEQEVMNRAHEQMMKNKLSHFLHRQKKSIPLAFQAQFVSISKANILRLANWEQNEKKWNDVINNTKNLMLEKDRLVQFLRDERTRINNGFFKFMNDNTKTHNKLNAIQRYINYLESSENGCIDSFEKLDQIKNTLSTLKDFVQSRNRFFNTKSDSKKHFEENFKMQSKKMG